MISPEEYRKLPENWVVNGAVSEDVNVNGAIYDAVDRDMYWAVDNAMDNAVWRAVWRAVNLNFGGGFDDALY